MSERHLPSGSTERPCRAVFFLSQDLITFLILGFVFIFAIRAWSHFSTNTYRRMFAALVDALILGIVGQLIATAPVISYGLNKLVDIQPFMDAGGPKFVGTASDNVTGIMFFGFLAAMNSMIAGSLPLFVLANAADHRHMFHPPAVLTAIIIALVSAIYSIGMESSKLRGTIGKHLIGIQVVDMQGQRLSLFRAGLRYLLKGEWLIPFFVVLAIDHFTNWIPGTLDVPLRNAFAVLALGPAFVCTLTKSNQALYDITAGCLVVPSADASTKNLRMVGRIAALLFLNNVYGMKLLFWLFMK
jgi:uncharacterized RDD family membrane protein YckC